LLNKDAFKLLKSFSETKTMNFSDVVSKVGENQARVVLQSLLKDKYIKSTPYMGENNKIVTAYEITEHGMEVFENRGKKWLTTYGPLIISMIALVISILVAILK